ncbi:uncharacterized protein LOC142591208 isoform X2 [Dermacentor variabilis]|uniref:uncharacterized protein LOC142591208 isoform X2 n=1 Tax=Dermacentor variabilis TaxID=34621 RepID=UPI003F5C81C9
MKTYLVACLLSAVSLGNAGEDTLAAKTTGSLTGQLRGGVEGVGPRGGPGIGSTAASSSSSAPGVYGNYPPPTGVGAGFYGMPYGGGYYPQYGPYAQYGPYRQPGPYGQYPPYGYYDEYPRYSAYRGAHSNFRGWKNRDQ